MWNFCRDSCLHVFFNRSPERFEGKKYSFSSDIWSFGLVLLEMATGEYPYKKVTAYLEMMEYVLNTPEPTLSKEMKFSKDLEYFLHRWFW